VNDIPESVDGDRHLRGNGRAGSSRKGGGRPVLGSSFVRDFINFNLEEGDLAGMPVAGGVEALRELYD
jgi:hypothetical protein